MTPMERFEQSVPENQREDVMTMIAEATQGYSLDASITIWERDRIDAINARARGVIKIGDKEHSFICEDGNRAGTVLEDWDGDREFAPFPRAEWAVQPRSDLIEKAISQGRAAFLLEMWGSFLTRTEIADLPRKYAYDRMMQPGVKVEEHYRAAAARHEMVLVSREEADATRRRLESAT